MGTDLDATETVLVSKKPEALVLASNGYPVGYALVTPEFVLLAKIDGTQIIRTEEKNLGAWLDRINADIAIPVGIWE